MRQNVTFTRGWMIVFTTFALAGISRAAGPFAVPKAAESFDVGVLHIDRIGPAETADNTPIVLIPGLASGPWVFSSLIPHLSTHPLYLITLPGFDGRPAVKGPLFPAVLRDLQALLKTRHIEQTIIIGHSLGGTLAIALGEEHPDLVGGIISLDGLPVFPLLASAPPAMREATASQYAARYAKLSKAEFLASEKAFMSAQGTTSEQLVAPAAERLAQSDPAATGAWLNETLNTDLRPRLSKLTVPLLLLMPHNPADPSPYSLEQTLGFYQSLLGGAPHAKVVPISPARHFLMLDQPDATQQAVAEFLSSAKR